MSRAPRTMPAAMRRTRSTRETISLGPGDNGILLTPAEFDRAEFADAWRYELVQGVLIVSPIPGLAERDPNHHLGTLLENYQESHPKGRSLDFTIHEHELHLGDNRRKVDRAIWAGLGRLPSARELPTVAIEFVSRRRRDRIREYETKRDVYLAAGIEQYWVIDRFQKTLTVFTRVKGKVKARVLQHRQTFRPRLLPVFELNLADLFDHANRWDDQEEA